MHQTHKVNHFHAHKNRARREQSHSHYVADTLDCERIFLFVPSRRKSIKRLWDLRLSRRRHSMNFLPLDNARARERCTGVKGGDKFHCSSAEENFVPASAAAAAGDADSSARGQPPGSSAWRKLETIAANALCARTAGAQKTALLATAAQTNTRKGIYVCNSSWSCAQYMFKSGESASGGDN